MIVPRPRLILWFGAIVVPFAGMAGTVPGALAVSVAAIAVFLVVAAIDAVYAPGRLRAVHVSLPDVVRLTKDREGRLEVYVRNATGHGMSIRVGFPFPAVFSCSCEALSVRVPEGVEESVASWPCTASQRGRYLLEACYIETPSVAGLWAARERRPVRCEVRVYPDLLTERKHLAGLFLHRGGLGVHAQRRVGHGREFEKLREYIPGDSFEDIHWKATARRRRPITKEFQVEHTREIYVVVDASRLSARPAGADGAPSTPMLERFVTAALILGLVAERQGDLFGLLTFADRVQSFIRAKNGKAHFGACRDALYTLQPQLVNPDFEDVFSFVRLRLRRRALVLFLTSLDDPALAEDFERSADVLCRQHLVLVNMLAPPGIAPVFAGDPLASLDAIYARLGGHMQWQRLRELDKSLRRKGVTFSMLDSEHLCLQLVSQYINTKQRQIL